MSIITDCRTDECYNQKYLNDTDAEFVAGFDWCTIMAVNNYFENIDDCYEITDIEPETDEEEELIEYLEDHQETADAYLKAIIENIKETILSHIECSRDELITSMIDNMSDEEFYEIQSAVDAKMRKNCIETYEFEKALQE